MNEMSPIMGHNNPPEDLKSDLEARYIGPLNQVAELLDAAATVPQELDEQTQPKAAELIKKMRFLETTLDGARKLEKEPFDAKVKLVNGVFNTRVEKLEAARKVINERSQAYLERKAAAERKRLQEEEEKRREAQRLAEAEAKAAEDRRLAAEEQERRARAEAEAAERRKLQAIEDAKQAEARAAAAREQERLAKIEQAEREKVKAKEDAERAEERRLHEDRMAKLKADREEQESAAAVSREAAAKALADRRVAEEQTRLARADVKTATRDGVLHLDNAVREENRAGKIAEKIAGPEADLARTRSEHGAVSTLSRIWTCKVVDRDLLPKIMLWPFIDADALEVAARKWMLTQEPKNRTMAGTVMQQETVGQVR